MRSRSGRVGVRRNKKGAHADTFVTSNRTGFSYDPMHVSHQGKALTWRKYKRADGAHDPSQFTRFCLWCLFVAALIGGGVVLITQILEYPFPDREGEGCCDTSGDAVGQDGGGLRSS